MEQERNEGHNDLHYPGVSLNNHARDLQNQALFNGGIRNLEVKPPHRPILENTKNSLLDLIGQLREAPDSRHRLRIAKQIERAVRSKSLLT